MSSSKPSILVLMRHGVTGPNERGALLGCKHDPHLMPKGRQQIELASTQLITLLQTRAMNSFSISILSSPLKRALQSAEIIYQKLNNSELSGQVSTLLTCPDLKEIDYGQWENLSEEEIRQRGQAKQLRAFRETPTQVGAPEGETLLEVGKRAASVLKILNNDSTKAPKVTICIAHKTLLRALLCIATGISLDEYRRQFTLEPAQFYILKPQPEQENQEVHENLWQIIESPR